MPAAIVSKVTQLRQDMDVDCGKIAMESYLFDKVANHKTSLPKCCIE